MAVGLPNHSSNCPSGLISPSAQSPEKQTLVCLSCVHVSRVAPLLHTPAHRILVLNIVIWSLVVATPVLPIIRVSFHFILSIASYLKVRVVLKGGWS